jgi:hypothetical protein
MHISHWLTGEEDNSVQHVKFEITIYKIHTNWKSQPYQQWHEDNFSTAEYGALAAFPFCLPIQSNLPWYFLADIE